MVELKVGKGALEVVMGSGSGDVVESGSLEVDVGSGFGDVVEGGSLKVDVGSVPEEVMVVVTLADVLESTNSLVTEGRLDTVLVVCVVVTIPPSVLLLLDAEPEMVKPGPGTGLISLVPYDTSLPGSGNTTSRCSMVVHPLPTLQTNMSGSCVRGEYCLFQLISRLYLWLGLLMTLTRAQF